MIAIFQPSNLDGHSGLAMGTNPTFIIVRRLGGLYIIKLLDHLHLHHI